MWRRVCSICSDCRCLPTCQGGLCPRLGVAVPAPAPEWASWSAPRLICRCSAARVEPQAVRGEGLGSQAWLTIEAGFNFSRDSLIMSSNFATCDLCDEHKNDTDGAFRV